MVSFILWLIGFGLGRLFTQAGFNVLVLTAYANETIMPALRKLMVCRTQIVIFFLWIKFVEKRPVDLVGFQSKESF